MKVANKTLPVVLYNKEEPVIKTIFMLFARSKSVVSTSNRINSGWSHGKSDTGSKPTWWQK